MPCKNIYISKHQTKDPRSLESIKQNKYQATLLGISYPSCMKSKTKKILKNAKEGWDKHHIHGAKSLTILPEFCFKLWKQEESDTFKVLKKKKLPT